jgi:hypothetical protein
MAGCMVLVSHALARGQRRGLPACPARPLDGQPPASLHARATVAAQRVGESEDVVLCRLVAALRVGK